MGLSRSIQIGLGGIALLVGAVNVKHVLNNGKASV